MKEVVKALADGLTCVNNKHRVVPVNRNVSGSTFKGFDANQICPSYPKASREQQNTFRVRHRRSGEKLKASVEQENASKSKPEI